MANDKDFRVKNGLYVATDANILGNTVIAQKLTANGNVNFTSSPNVALGPVGNVVITGGSNGQYLQTNGSGGLAWAAVSGAASISNGNSLHNRVVRLLVNDNVFCRHCRHSPTKINA